MAAAMDTIKLPPSALPSNCFDDFPFRLHHGVHGIAFHITFSLYDTLHDWRFQSSALRPTSQHSLLLVTCLKLAGPSFFTVHCTITCILEHSMGKGDLARLEARLCRYSSMHAPPLHHTVFRLLFLYFRFRLFLSLGENNSHSRLVSSAGSLFLSTWAGIAFSRSPERSN